MARARRRRLAGWLHSDFFFRVAYEENSRRMPPRRRSSGRRSRRRSSGRRSRTRRSPRPRFAGPGSSTAVPSEASERKVASDGLLDAIEWSNVQEVIKFLTHPKQLVYIYHVETADSIMSKNPENERARNIYNLVEEKFGPALYDQYKEHFQD